MRNDALREYKFKLYLNANHFVIFNGKKGESHPHTWEFVIEVLVDKDTFIKFLDFLSSPFCFNFKDGIYGKSCSILNSIFVDRIVRAIRHPFFYINKLTPIRNTAIVISFIIGFTILKFYNSIFIEIFMDM